MSLSFFYSYGDHRDLHSFPTRRSSDLPIYTNSSRTSEAALWPSTYISPLSNSTPCIDRKSGSAGMPRPISYAVFCLKKKTARAGCHHTHAGRLRTGGARYRDRVDSASAPTPTRTPPCNGHCRHASMLHHLRERCHYLFSTATATTEIYTLSLHDALPIFRSIQTHHERQKQPYGRQHTYHHYRTQRPAYEKTERSEERRVGKECRSRWSPYP